MRITVRIDCDNAAFGDGAGVEAARILHELAEDMVKQGVKPGDEFWLRDANGNRVGEAKASR